ncbi:MAG: hypothetical protein WC759_02085 [Candidatus Micrarchaeia archaeon]|jgi:hypothetical protein
MDAPRIQKSAPPAQKQDGRQHERPNGNFFHRLLEPLRSTDRHHDLLNIFNVERWEEIAAKSLASRDDQRLEEAFNALAGLAEDVGAIGYSRKAWRALSRLYINNIDGSMADRSLARDALRVLFICAHDEPEVSREVAKIFAEELNRGAQPIHKLRNLYGVLKEALELASDVDVGEKMTTYTECCKALMGIMRQEFEEMTMPGKVSMEFRVTALGISGIRMQIEGLEKQVAELQ